MKAQIELEERILRESEERLKIESDVSKMEQEENELIQRLQNTQLLQQSAFDEMEKVVSASSTASAGFQTKITPEKKGIISSGKKGKK